MEIVIFGQLTDCIGKPNVEIEQVDSVSMLKKILLKKFPCLSKMTFLVAVNKTVVSEKTKIYENDKVALLPPYSGG